MIHFFVRARCDDMEMKTQLASCSDFFDAQNSDYSLPRWNDLPDIELYMDQVITLLNKYIENFSLEGEVLLTPSMINNYVKHGIIPSPNKKRYSRVHLARLIIICIMKPVLPISSIAQLLENLLKTRTDQQVFDYFSEHYEYTFSDIMKVLRRYSENSNADDLDISAMLSLTVMHAAAVSGGSKLLAQKALVEIDKIENDGMAKHGKR